MKMSTVNKGLVAHLKYCYGACVKRYRHLSSQELSEKVYNILEHTMQAAMSHGAIRKGQQLKTKLT